MAVGMREEIDVKCMLTLGREGEVLYVSKLASI